MTENVLATPISQNPEIRRTADYRVYYANQNRIRVTNADVQLFFGQLVDDPPGSATHINEESVAVIIGPAGAKLLALALATAVASYEQQFGEIQVPGDALQKAEETRKAVMEASRRQGK